MVDSSSLFFFFLCQPLKTIVGLMEALLLFLLYRWGNGQRSNSLSWSQGQWWQSRDGVRGAWLQSGALHKPHVPSVLPNPLASTFISLIRGFNSVYLRS